jgi:hypothetical protein
MARKTPDLVYFPTLVEGLKINRLRMGAAGYLTAEIGCGDLEENIMEIKEKPFFFKGERGIVMYADRLAYILNTAVEPLEAFFPYMYCVWNDNTHNKFREYVIAHDLKIDNIVKTTCELHNYVMDVFDADDAENDSKK